MKTKSSFRKTLDYVYFHKTFFSPESFWLFDSDRCKSKKRRFSISIVIFARARGIWYILLSLYEKHLFFLNTNHKSHSSLAFLLRTWRKIAIHCIISCDEQYTIFYLLRSLFLSYFAREENIQLSPFLFSCLLIN